MAFRWRADDGPTLNADLVALILFMGSGPVLLRNPIFLRFSRMSGPPAPPPPPLWVCYLCSFCHALAYIVRCMVVVWVFRYHRHRRMKARLRELRYGKAKSPSCSATQTYQYIETSHVTTWSIILSKGADQPLWKRRLVCVCVVCI